MSATSPFRITLASVFILAASFGLASFAQPSEDQENTTETGQPQPEPAADEEVEQIIEDLERAATQDRIATPLPSDPAQARSGRLLREGSFLRLRRGRVVRNERGEWEFRMDAGVDAASAEPPMVLLECQNLMTIEAIAERHGDSVTFTVSGEVFVYKDRNYLLPRYYVVNRSTDEVIPTQ